MLNVGQQTSSEFLSRLLVLNHTQPGVPRVCYIVSITGLNPLNKVKSLQSQSCYNPYQTSIPSLTRLIKDYSHMNLPGDGNFK